MIVLRFCGARECAMPAIDEGRWSGEHSPRSSLRRVVSSSAAAIGSVVMHALLALPVVWVESAPKLRRPDQMGAGSSAIASAEEPTETLILVNIPGLRGALNAIR